MSEEIHYRDPIEIGIIYADNIEEYIDDMNLPAYEWIKEIYISIFGKLSFYNWFYQLFTNTIGYSRPFQSGLHHLKDHIRISMNNASFNPYTTYITIHSDKENKKTYKESKKTDQASKQKSKDSEKDKDDRLSEYYIKIPSSNINFDKSLRKLEYATRIYLESLGQKISE